MIAVHQYALLATFLISGSVQTARSQQCALKPSGTKGIHAVTVDDLRCLAKEPSHQRLLCLTYAAWCTPCRAHLPGAIAFAAANRLKLIVIVPEAETDALLRDADAQVRKLDTGVRVVVVSDAYGKTRNPKYKRFLKELIPPPFPLIEDYSKYILFDKSGNVSYVSSWKDNRKNNWRSDTAIQNQRILPLLQAHE